MATPHSAPGKAGWSISDLLPGTLVCLILAYVARLAGTRVPIVGGAVFGILIGMLTGRAKRPESCVPGIRFTSRKILQYSIILLGFDMNMTKVLSVGGQSILAILLTLTAALLSAFMFSKLLSIRGNTGILIGVGTAICGGSAIAATAPVLGAKEEEVTQAISTIFLFNVLAVFLFPLIGRLLGLSDRGFGIWAGTAVNDTSSVVASASAWSQVAGNDVALASATVVKLTRTLMIIPVSLGLSFYMVRKTDRRTSSMEDIGAAEVMAGSQFDDQPERLRFSLLRTFPWFVLGFVATSLVSTFVPLPAGLAPFMVRLGKFMIIMAMTAIGLSTDPARLIRSGWRPLFLGLSCWVVAALVALSIMKLADLW